MEYDHRKIEQKWQREWLESGAFSASDDRTKKKYYTLIEFPYPSGAGLHVGHPRPYIGLDIVARKRRREGYNVLYPMGWDAFGLPTENYAIATGRDPREVTKENSDTFRRQIQSLGLSFDWSREVNTADPSYYKWTQWIFLQFFKHGLAYKAKSAINWCPKDKIGLANEEVVEGKCERCGTMTEKREREQWMLAITRYAKRLYDDLDTVDYIERAKIQQRNWIGPSEGAEIDFPLAGSDKKITVFTTRADTLYGVTYLVLAPEHSLIGGLIYQNTDEVNAYIAKAKVKPDIERIAEGKEKTGIELKGVTAVNPATKEKIPIWIADYVLASYGTGAIMAVPAHDERDFAFAKKFNLPVRRVITSDAPPPYTGAGVLVHSGEFDGLESSEAIPKIGAKFGRLVTAYKLRDWVFSRQRYWGEPIPMIKCEKDGWVPVPEHELPVELPVVKKYQPTDTGESPLANIAEWVHTKCPKCKGPAKRETDVMPNWAGSSWYYLRYCDPKNNAAPADKTKLGYWTPVDWYNGGMEHTVLHLLYSRFWHKFLFDIDVVPTPEPYAKRTSHGVIFAEDGRKMSKSFGNVINPDDIVARFGADSLRVYEMFMGPFDQAIAWSTNGLVGMRRFLERVWALSSSVGIAQTSTELEMLLNQTIKKVSDDIESMKFNTAVSALMILSNKLGELGTVPKESYETLLKLFAPFAPHITEELWHSLGHKNSIHLEPWPSFDSEKLHGKEVTVVIQIGGKTRGTIVVSRGSSEEEVISKVRKDKKLNKLAPESPRRTVYVPDRVLNLIP